MVQLRRGVRIQWETQPMSPLSSLALYDHQPIGPLPGSTPSSFICILYISILDEIQINNMYLCLLGIWRPITKWFH